MAYNQGLADDIRAILSDRPNLVVKKMFGGVGFMLNGNMACGVSGESIMVRVGLDDYDGLLTRPHVRVFDVTGKPMRGWVWVDPDGFKSDQDLKSWIMRGVAFAESLPPK